MNLFKKFFIFLGLAIVIGSLDASEAGKQSWWQSFKNWWQERQLNQPVRKKGCPICRTEYSREVPEPKFKICRTDYHALQIKEHGKKSVYQQAKELKERQQGQRFSAFSNIE